MILGGARIGECARCKQKKFLDEAGVCDDCQPELLSDDEEDHHAWNPETD